MKTLQSYAVLVLFVISCVFVSCQEEKSTFEPKGKVTLALGLTGDYVNVTESPLLRSTSLDDVYALQIYSAAMDENEYIPYAYGMFHGGKDIFVEFDSEFKYKIQATVVINGINRLDFNGGNFAFPCGVNVNDSICYSPYEGFEALNHCPSELKDKGTIWRPDIDRYYGELEGIKPVNYPDKKIELEVKRVVYGIGVVVKGLIGSIDFRLNESETFTLDNPNGQDTVKLEKILVSLGEWDYYTPEWFVNPVEEAQIEISWRKNDGSQVWLYGEEKMLKRNMKYTFNIDLSRYNEMGDEAEIIIKLEESDWESEEEIDLNKIYYGDIIISNAQELEEFRNAGYEVITGNLTVKYFDGDYWGATDLLEVRGDLSFIATESCRFNELGDFPFGLLTFVGGDLEFIATVEDAFKELVYFKGAMNIKNIGGSLRLTGTKGSFSQFAHLYMASLQSIGKNLEITTEDTDSFNNFKGCDFFELQYIGSNLIIENVVAFTDYCDLTTALTNFQGGYFVSGNGYNPTLEAILEGNCSL